MLRAILYSDDSYYRLAGYRKIDPITSLHAEAKFLEAVEALFWKGNKVLGEEKKKKGSKSNSIFYRLATW